ncbi:MAG: phosphatase PAP2 family protein [Chitinophagaceae bacterium]
MDLFNTIEQFDFKLFKLINIDGSVPFLNGFMLLMREALTWIPLYAFILYWTIKYNRNNSIPFIVLTLACFALTDYISASILKPHFARLRPCYNEELKGIMNSLVGCGGENSFPSSHASNHFGLATFWYFAIYSKIKKRWGWLWIWAIIIGYAQIYVGKHYPLDILAGAAFGIMSGLLCFYIYLKFINRNFRIAHSVTSNT